MSTEGNSNPTNTQKEIEYIEKVLIPALKKVIKEAEEHLKQLKS